MKLTKKQKRNILSFMIGIIILIIALIFGVIDKNELREILGLSPNVESKIDIENEKYKVVRVVDGDTFVVIFNGKEEKVRLIGIDTPESVHPDKTKNSDYGVIASNYTKELLLEKEIYLEFDVSQRDKYGRLLAYAYLENGEMLNKKLLEEGYANLATYPPNVKYVEEFKKIQKKAREDKKGFWSEDVF